VVASPCFHDDQQVKGTQYCVVCFGVRACVCDCRRAAEVDAGGIHLPDAAAHFGLAQLIAREAMAAADCGASDDVVMRM
jgi:hypothetical protein